MQDHSQRAVTRRLPPALALACATLVVSGSCIAGDRLSAAFSHTCAIRADASLACWGDNSSGETDAPAGQFRQVSAAEIHSCALGRDSGAISCWGYPGPPSLLDAPSGAHARVSARGQHACALRNDGGIACWGWNTFGEAASPAGAGFLDVSAGPHHNCAIRADRTITCWGRDNYGQATPPAALRAVAVSAGGDHSCALDATDGSATCWGRNHLGQAAPPAGPFSAIGTGQFHSCGLRPDATIACWGGNNDGQSAPVPAGPFSELGVGYVHTCALRFDGAVVCWGNNAYGQSAAPAGDFGALPPDARLAFLAEVMATPPTDVLVPVVQRVAALHADANPANDRAACPLLGSGERRLEHMIATDRLEEATGIPLLVQFAAVEDQLACP